MEGEKKPAVSDVGAWAMNIISSVGIIMANKQLMSSGGYGFTFGLFLHFYVPVILSFSFRIGVICIMIYCVNSVIRGFVMNNKLYFGLLLCN